ncbi:hypothetical protein RGUI_4117 [Rhodovulum sp. P5]|uniref:hypothetical protein n=1 Tax=Rhodovulum phage vB_RhkS_P1 TaxID=1873452 RepID=UPI00080AC184|nr:hypothetical protein [Rhodovulum sp. P5]YP_009285942.1 hypothetical protein BI026_gp57 [Rhodovulum phage vB_RhkS_P1]ANT39928.1 hypothetical protein Rhks_57 [Rhodovulum phage vB_RhkS_P1]ARE38996.1 hypothetical protein RGUI_0855 [Rhodovulum sp. P5]ARE42258.1 hypothetical protein RGUI_4117 [Rhodovulum sp. P5]
MHRDALYATLAHTLGLSSRDLSEIGGFSDRFARDLLAGRRPVPADVRQALLDIQDDIDALTDSIEADVSEGEGVIWLYGTTADLRAARPDIPGRGAAAGGFIGPFRIAALTAWDALRERGIDVDILFCDPDRAE